MPAPKLDHRTREEVIASALLLAAQYTPQWSGVGNASDPGRRLIDLFARLVELLLERLNRVPEKNFLSFLDLTGVERFPGAPAEAPVTFLVSKRAPQGGQAPRGTQVATTQTQTSDARVFETRNAFFATPAKLESIVTVSPATDRFARLPVPATPPAAATLANAVPVAIFSDTEPALQDVGHILYIGSGALFGRPDAANVTVTFTLSSGAFPAGVTWKRFDKKLKSWAGLGVPVTMSVPAPGQVSFTFAGLTGAAATVIEGVEDVWLAAHFDAPFDASFTAPVIVGAQGVAAAPVLPVTRFDAAFTNSDRIDLSKPYYPFGRRPAYGDAFYFASQAAFGADVEQAVVSFVIRPNASAALVQQFAGAPDPTVVRTVAQWQYLDQSGQWVDLARFDHQFTFTAGGVAQISNFAPPGSPHAAEGTFIGVSGAALVSVDLSGFQDRIGLREVNGVVNRWIRVLLLSDRPYGHDGVAAAGGFVGPLWIVPTIEGLSISYTPRTAPQPLTNLAALNSFQLQHASSGGAISFAPFTSLAERRETGFAAFGSAPALYFAFDRAFGDVFISVFFDLAGPPSTLFSPLESGNPNIAWEYWSANTGWAALDVDDQTFDLTTSGAIGFPGPRDAGALALFAQLDPDPGAPVPRWWFRARLAGGGYDHPPRVKGIYPNTVLASNVSTARGDLIVGSSNGEPDQTFGLVKGPVLGGELWVREPELPSGEELRELAREHADDAAARLDPGAALPVSETRTIASGESETWVRWRRVPNFRISGARSRHYTLEPVAAEAAFGDGTRALIPPPGKNNLVVRGFLSGGGEAANRDTQPLAVKELTTSLSFIDKVFNVQAASAGASPWTLDEIQEFGPQTIKNRGRAVTTEDYEWMVRQRFSQIARVRCLPTLAPAAGGGLTFKAGAVTVLVVPKGEDLRPQPSQGLLRRIREFLTRTALGNIGADIFVKGPDYAEVRISATVVPVKPELTSVVVRRAAAALEAFLHPLTGGEDGNGYGFGRPVYLSEVHAVLERIEEVDYVVSAAFLDLPGADAFPVGSNRLASSGTHRIVI